MKITVEDWMTPNPVSIEPESSALSALELMIGGGFRHLPVVDETRGVLGILTLTDLRTALDEPLSLRNPPTPEACEMARDYSVGELMSYAPCTTTAGASLESAAGTLAARRIGCLPVVDVAGALVGLLSETDVLRALMTLLALERGEKRPPALARLDTVESRLRAERWRLLNRLAGLARTGRELAAEQRDQPLDPAELGSDQQSVDRDERIAQLCAMRLADLDRALDRAAQGRLGICDNCAGAIPPARVRALPGTSVCVRCARSREDLAAGRPPRGIAPLGSRIRGQVHTPQGEGRLLRIAPFGTCGRCGEVEGYYDEDEDLVLCSSPGCEVTLTDVVELAVVQMADEVISVVPEKIVSVDPQPYD